MTKTILVLNGPNLNLLGSREPEIYGRETLDDIAAALTDHAATLGVEVDIRQSNHEGHLIDWLHEADRTGAAAAILNPGGYGHTSVAIALTDPDARESFRHVDLVALVAQQVIKGCGPTGYLLALDAAARL